ncbi:P-loop containing nucleoside triphosphate hydrolase protein [Mortierella sp. GBAus27b]|nr:P-loop containing nucleoside triphosphate hydrolase protein [Mortierella sp. GBAus27b]
MAAAVPSKAEMSRMVRECVPEADDAIVEYIAGYLDENSEMGDEEDAISEFVRPLLEDAGGDPKAIDKLCNRFQTLFDSHAKDRKTTQGSSGSDGLTKLLEKPVHMLSQDAVSATGKIGARSVDLEAVSGRKVLSQVDTEKLKKAEAKIAAKMAKRTARVEYSASKLLDKKDEIDLMAVNPILDYTTTKGKNKDVKLENFDISFAGKRILTNANLTLAFGRRYGLVGRNGIGKSTLLRTLSRREVNVPTHISILHVEQEAVLAADQFREHLLGEEKRLTALTLEMEKGQPEDDTRSKEKFEDDREKALADLREVYAKLEAIESDKAESRAASILSGLGFLPNQHHNPTRSFSGGWRMRLALARALFNKPDLLLLDEPTNMLDIPAVIWLEHYLQTWPNTLLVVSHDREFLDEVATDILHQHTEKLDYYKGNFTQFDTTKAERHKSQLREYENQVQYRAHLQAFIDRWRYNANRAAQAQMKIKILEKLPELEPPEVENPIFFKFPDPEKLGPPILQMTDCTFGYSSERIILDKIYLDMQMDSRIAVVGPNGAGKSTMLKLLTGKLEPQKGLVHRHGRLRFALFSQHHVDQLDVTVSSVEFMAKTWPGKTEEEYRRQLGAFGVTGMVGLQQISTLSGGQKSRVAFACLGLQNPHFLILDEPTNHLDMDSIDALTGALKEFKGGVVIVSHDERFIKAVCNEIWVCEGGGLKKFQGEGIKEYKEYVLAKGL